MIVNFFSDITLKTVYLIAQVDVYVIYVRDKAPSSFPACMNYFWSSFGNDNYSNLKHSGEKNEHNLQLEDVSVFRKCKSEVEV